MGMTGRERLLSAISNGRPDRLPCQVHSWMGNYLKKFLGGTDQYGAYAMFEGMDWVVYCNPNFIYDEKDLANWQVERKDLGIDSDGNHAIVETIKTPSGTLRLAKAWNDFTCWDTEMLLKSEEDFEIWTKHVPIPSSVDWTPVLEAKRKTGDKGIVRGGFFGFGQGSPWQDLCRIMGTEECIMLAMDKPDFVHHALKEMLEKKLKVVERAGRFEMDLVETGGGAGSSTVISPSMQREFCVPYDRRQHEAFRAGGTKTVYHLCGGLMPLLEIVAGNGADGLETMTPPGMGGDCNLAEADKRVGDKLFFVGGFDQGAGFERGTPESVRKQVEELFEATKPHAGYICSPSDHFFSGDPENVKAFAKACRDCVY